MDNRIEVEIEKAMFGRLVWLDIKMNYQINEDMLLVIMPEDDDSLNITALELLNGYLGKKFLSKAIVVASKDYSNIFNDSKIIFEKRNKNDVEDILKYYRLTQFTQNIVVISVDEPFGGGGIIGKIGITLKDYVENAIYV